MQIKKQNLLKIAQYVLEKFSNNIVILTTTALLFGTCNATYAAGITFNPIGSQLDEDPIRDIEKESGDSITFQVNLDTQGIAGEEIDILAWAVTWDSSELIPDFFENNTQGVAERISTSSPDTLGRNATILERVKTGLNDFPIFSYSFVVTNPTNDGVRDFDLGFFTAISLNSGDLTDQFNQLDEPEVEVQAGRVGVPEPPEVPEPLTILGSLTVIGISFALKKKHS